MQLGKIDYGRTLLRKGDTIIYEKGDWVDPKTQTFHILKLSVTANKNFRIDLQQHSVNRYLHKILPYSRAVQMIKQYGNDLDRFASNIYLEDQNIRMRSISPRRPSINKIIRTSRAKLPKRNDGQPSMIHTGQNFHKQSYRELSGEKRSNRQLAPIVRKPVQPV